MASFRDILTATEEALVNLFFRVKTSPNTDFIVRIDRVAQQLGLNHTQLVCAVGFNKNIRDLTDILSVIGFNSFKSLSYRRDELFCTDTYIDLPIDNVLDIYTERIEDPDILAKLRELLTHRFESIERRMEGNADPALIISYKMEIHAIYSGGIATEKFAAERAVSHNAQFRIKTDEVKMMVEHGLVPAGNLFFLETIHPDEKAALIETGQVTDAMVRNRLQNREISQDERDMLEDHV